MLLGEDEQAITIYISKLETKKTKLSKQKSMIYSVDKLTNVSLTHLDLDKLDTVLEINTYFGRRKGIYLTINWIIPKT